MDTPWEWEEVVNFGSLREHDCFIAWLNEQVASGIAEEIRGPADETSYPDDRWFKHVPTGAVWHLVSIDNRYGPGFWPARDKAA